MKYNKLKKSSNTMNLSKRSVDKELLSGGKAKGNTMNLSKQSIDKELLSGGKAKGNTYITNFINKDIKDIVDIKYIYLILLILIFFLFGLILSELIDYIFPEFDDSNDDYRITIEIIGEIGVAYLIYYSLKTYSERFIKILYNSISKSPPFYLNQLLLIAFSSGIYKHLQKSTHKVNHIKKKYINIEYLSNFITKKY
jgi:hypothetical protein